MIIPIRCYVTVTVFWMNDLIVLRKIKVDQSTFFTGIITVGSIEAIDVINHLIFTAVELVIHL